MKTFPMKNEIGVFCQCALIYTKPAENTRGPAPRLCCGDPGRGKGAAPPRSRFKACKQNFSFIQAAKGKRSGEARRKGTPLELDSVHLGKPRARPGRRGTGTKQASTPDSTAGRADFQVRLNQSRMMRTRDSTRVRAVGLDFVSLILGFGEAEELVVRAVEHSLELVENALCCFP